MTQIHKSPGIQIAKNNQAQKPDRVQMHNNLNQPYDKYKDVPEEVMKVAEGMEAQFTNHLLNEMRKSQGSNMGQHEKLYQSMLDRERAQMMAKTTTGTNIKDLVLEQVYPNFNKPNLDNVKMYQHAARSKGELQ